MTSNPPANKVLVPENEYDAALRTLTNVLLPPAAESSSNDSKTWFTLSSSSSPIRKDIHNSIVGTIERSIEPIPTVDFEKLQKFGSTPVKKQLAKIMENPDLQEDDLSVSSCSTDEDDNSESTTNAASSDSEMEDDELLDRPVWERAKELRQKVRMASKNLQLVREEKMGQALSQVQSEINDLIRLEKEWNDTVEERFNQAGENQLDCNTLVDKEDMEKALANIKKQLDNLENVLPENLQGLRDTIESVSYSLQKKMRHDLSRTEGAIRLRDCDDVWKSMKSAQRNNEFDKRVDSSVKENEQPEKKMDAATRFAMFVSKV